MRARADRHPIAVRVPPGIGDFAWVYSKLVGLGRPLMVEAPHSNHARLAQIAELLPMVEEVGYARFTNPVHCRVKARPDWTRRRLEAEAAAGPVVIELNHWLEAGCRIEAFMPELKTVHHYRVEVPDEQAAEAEAALGGWSRFVALYCANADAGRRWKAWTAGEWAALGDRIAARADIQGLVLVGAEWDKGIARRVGKALRVPALNLTGRLPLGATLEVVRRSLCLVAFASGIPILATAMGLPNLMLYPAHLAPMMAAWAPPEMLESGAHRPMLWGSPRPVLEWVMEWTGGCE